MSILRVEDLTLTKDGTTILEDLNFGLEENRIYALVGPNGAGKSSLAFAIMGLEGYRAFDGDLIYKGESIKGLDPYERAQRGITLAWQEPARYEGLTVEQFIEAAAGDDGGEKAAEAIEMAGMDPDSYLDRNVDASLSGGERKKIELASIIAMKPELALLDEPDSGIDVESLERIFESVELLKEGGTTVVLITHSATVLEKAEHAFLMCCGSVIDSGPVEDISSYFEEKCIPCGHKNEPELNEGS